MSKYYKEEDLQRALIGFIRETGIDEKPYDYAVNVLDDLPTIEVSEDCIERDFIISQLLNLMSVENEHYEGMDKALKLIEHAPRVVPNRAEGEWTNAGILTVHC